MYNIIDDFSLKGHNTFGLECVATKFAEYSNEKDLPSLWSEIEDLRLPAFHIGEGSNILFTGRYEGVVVSSNILDLEMIPTGGGEVSITAGAGIKLDNLIERCCDAGLWGLENLSLIPGTVGASVVQNVGAYGRDASDSVSRVRVFDTHLKRFLTLAPEECQFGYRTSMFKQPVNKGRYVVVNVTYRLSALPEPHLDYGNLGAMLKDRNELSPVDVRNAVIEVRRTKLPDPAEIGSAGSYFTNPVVSREQFDELLMKSQKLWGAYVSVPHWETDNGVKISAAWMLDRLGWKGRKIGGAMVWPSQPLVIVNADGKATVADIISLEKSIVSDVESQLGVTLRPEVEKVPLVYKS